MSKWSFTSIFIQMSKALHVSKSTGTCTYVAPLKKTFDLTLSPDAFLTQKTPATPPLGSVNSNAASTLAGLSVPAIRLFFLYIFRLFVFFIAMLRV